MTGLKTKNATGEQCLKVWSLRKAGKKSSEDPIQEMHPVLQLTHLLFTEASPGMWKGGSQEAIVKEGKT